MKAWRIVLIPTLITLTIGGIYLLSVYKQRQKPGIVGQADNSQPLSDDDLAALKQQLGFEAKPALPAPE